MSTKRTRDGYAMHASVWELPCNAEDGSDQWTWGWVPAAGSRYQAVGRGVWSTEAKARAAMAVGVPSELSHRIATAMTESISHEERVRLEVASIDEALAMIDAQSEDFWSTNEPDGSVFVGGSTDGEGEEYRLALVTAAPKGWESVEGGAR